MKVKELIEQLSAFKNQEQEVFFPNYVGHARAVILVEEMDFIYRNNIALRDEATFVADRENTEIKKAVLLY